MAVDQPGDQRSAPPSIWTSSASGLGAPSAGPAYTIFPSSQTSAASETGGELPRRAAERRGRTAWPSLRSLTGPRVRPKPPAERPAFPSGRCADAQDPDRRRRPGVSPGLVKELSARGGLPRRPRRGHRRRMGIAPHRGPDAAHPRPLAVAARPAGAARPHPRERPLSSLPVVILTGVTGRRRGREGEGALAEYLTKPFTRTRADRPLRASHARVGTFAGDAARAASLLTFRGSGSRARSTWPTTSRASRTHGRR